MPIVFKKGLSATAVAGLEQRLARTFPKDYANFLQEMNGFYLTAPDYAQLSLNSVGEGEVAFDRLFSAFSDEESNDVVAFNEEFINELDFLGNALAIGEDGGGNPYVIIDGPERSGVYYWDRTHSHEGDVKNNFDIPEEDDCGNLFWVAPMFTDFYNIILKSMSSNVIFSKEL